MGLFQSRPEEPDEWAGLPSEPWEPRVPSEVLPPSIADPYVFGSAGITVSVPTELLVAETQQSLDTDDE